MNNQRRECITANDRVSDAPTFIGSFTPNTPQVGTNRRASSAARGHLG